MTSSSKLREKGNEIFKSIDQNFAPVLRESRLKEALIFYNKASTEADCKLDKSSACKNILTTSNAILKIYSHEKSDEKISDYYALEAQKNAKHAYFFGLSVQSKEWLNSIEQKSFDSIEFYLNCLENSSYKYRITRLLSLIDECLESVKPQILYEICNLYYKKTLGINTIDTIRGNLHDIKECNFFFEESQRLINKLKDENKMNEFLEMLEFELEELKNDFTLQNFILEGLNSKFIAQNILESSIKQQELLNFEAIWDVIDWYKDSILKTRDYDIENEAEVYSDLGYLYDKILKNKTLSKKYFKQSWDLAESLKPKVLTKLLWYKRCLNAFQEYQKEIVDEEEKNFETEKSKVLEEIKADLELINVKALLDTYKFLEFVYDKFPPKKGHKLDLPLSSNNIKKQLQKSITHYHPDKNSKQEYGSAWFFLADAITKQLTRYYENMKSAS